MTLAKPEMVPFRLTQNIIDAFGVSGHEGAYRRVCEITLRVLREHREVIVVIQQYFHSSTMEAMITFFDLVRLIRRARRPVSSNIGKNADNSKAVI